MATIFAILIGCGLLAYGILTVHLASYRNGKKPMVSLIKTNIPMDEFPEIYKQIEDEGPFGTKIIKEHLEPNVWLSRIVSQYEPEKILCETKYRRIGGAEESPILHIEEFNGVENPFGENHYITENIFDKEGAAQLVLEELRPYPSTFSLIWSTLKFRASNWTVGRKMNKLYRASLAESTEREEATGYNGKTTSAIWAAGSPGTNVISNKPAADYSTEITMSALAMVSFVVYFGWEAAILLAPIILLHEYGHLLGYQLTGKTGNRMMLIPFMGGVAVAGETHRTEFERAFCALMGPAICVPLSIVLTVAAFGVGDHWSYSWLAYGALICSFMNAINLIPIIPLDGGHIIESIARWISPGQAKHALLALTAGGALILYSAGYTGIAMFAAFLGLPALLNQEEQSNLTPLSGKTSGILVLGYLITLGTHLGCASLIFSAFY